MSVQYATCDASIRACYPVLAQLRPHLEAAAFMAQVQRQMANHDYRLAYLQHEGQVAAVSGVSEATNAASIDGTKWVVVTP